MLISSVTLSLFCIRSPTFSSCTELPSDTASLGWSDRGGMLIICKQGKASLDALTDFFSLKKEKLTWLTQSKYFYFVWEGHKVLDRTEGTPETTSSEKAEIRKVPEMQVQEAEVNPVGIIVGVILFQPAASACAGPLSSLSLEGGFDGSTVACRVVRRGQICLTDSTPRLHTVGRSFPRQKLGLCTAVR